SNRPPTSEFGLWGWQGLHQSLPDKDLFHGVIPDGAADPGPCAAQAQGGPRSALRFGRDDGGFG
ncbi:hypothetical protein, partial [Aquidulcibacter paucihalophilus]|uniref:hypothetical protein n=1 Tax=Aquidulcibacter paucihalophilus TaxID=1978549 RepID=UPI001E33A0EA